MRETEEANLLLLTGAKYVFFLRTKLHEWLLKIQYFVYLHTYPTTRIDYGPLYYLLRLIPVLIPTGGV